MSQQAEIQSAINRLERADLVTPVNAAEIDILRNELWEMMREQRPPFHDIFQLARAINQGATS